MDEPVAKRTRRALADKANQQLAKGKGKVMSNGLLLKKIADLLPAQDLLNLREFCPAWNSIFIPQLIEKHSPIELDFDLAEDEEKSVENFIEVMESSTKIPFGNYNLVNCRQDLLNFGSVVGHSVKKLSISWFWDEYWMTSKFRQLIFEQLPQLTDLEFLFPESGDWEPTPEELAQLREFPSTLNLSSNQLPNLKRFNFNFTGYQERGAWQIVSEVVHCATALEELRLPGSGLHEHDQRTYEHFLDPVLQGMRDSNIYLHKLKQLELGSVNLSILEALLGMARRPKNALSLETFSISVMGGGWLGPEVEYDTHAQDEEFYDRHRNEMWEMLKTFLELQEPTLEDLSLWLSFDSITVGPVPITLPQLTQLRALAVSTPSYAWGDDPFPDLQFDEATFESAFPRLKKLKFDIAEVSDGGEYRKVSHSELTEMFFEVKIGMAMDLPTLFPSLTRLNLCLRCTYGKDMDKAAEMYANLWTLWPSLTHMKLNFCLFSNSVNPDKLLTGVPGGQHGALKAELDTLIAAKRPTFEELSVLVHKYKTRPGIIDLTRLEEFQLEWLYLGEEEEKWLSQLSDVAVYCGLALVGPQLRKITFVDGVADLLSEDCLEYMRTQGERRGNILPNVVINFE